MRDRYHFVCWFDVVNSQHPVNRPKVNPFVDGVERLATNVYSVQFDRLPGDEFRLWARDHVQGVEIANRVWDEAARVDLQLHAAMHLCHTDPAIGLDDDLDMGRCREILEDAEPGQCLASASAADFVERDKVVGVRRLDKAVPAAQRGEVWVVQFGDPRLRMYRGRASRSQPSGRGLQQWLRESCEGMLGAAVDATGATHGSLILVNPDEDDPQGRNRKLDIVAVHPPRIKDNIAGEAEAQVGPERWDLWQQGVVLGLGQGVTGWVAREGEAKPIDSIEAWEEDGRLERCRVERSDDPVLNELEQYRAGKTVRYLDLHPGTKSEVAVPIFRAGNDVIGVINLDGRRANEFGDLDRQVLEAVASMAGSMILDARLAQVSRTIEALERCREKLASEMDERQWQNVMERVREALDAQVVEFWRLGGDADEYVLQYTTDRNVDVTEVPRYPLALDYHLTVYVGTTGQPLRTRCAYRRRKALLDKAKDAGRPIGEKDEQALWSDPNTHGPGRREPWLGVPVPVEPGERPAAGVLRMNRIRGTVADEPPSEQAQVEWFGFRLFTLEEELLLASFARALGRVLPPAEAKPRK